MHLDMPHSKLDRAAVFIDYENLYGHLARHQSAQIHASDAITELLQAVKHHLQTELEAGAVIARAYADFAGNDDKVRKAQNDLYLLGVEPRFVPTSIQHNAAEIQLAVDAIHTLHARNDIATLIVVSGDRPYVPLLQHCVQVGARALAITYQRPHVTGIKAGEELYLDAQSVIARMSPAINAKPRRVHPPPERLESTNGRHGKHVRITDTHTLDALSIINDYFGHYSEIFLTPCLRKLSQEMDSAEFDPKYLIGDMEAAGAIWLDKRRGSPHDYTVLLIDDEHPDVVELRSNMDENDSQSVHALADAAERSGISWRGLSAPDER